MLLAAGLLRTTLIHANMHSTERLHPDHHPPPQVAQLGHLREQAGRRHNQLEFSCRPAALATAAGGSKPAPALQLAGLAAGQQVVGYVQEVTAECVWLALGPTVRGRVHAFDASEDLAVVSELAEHFRPGQVRCCCCCCCCCWVVVWCMWPAAMRCCVMLCAAAQQHGAGLVAYGCMATGTESAAAVTCAPACHMHAGGCWL